LGYTPVRARGNSGSQQAPTAALVLDRSKKFAARELSNFALKSQVTKQDHKMVAG